VQSNETGNTGTVDADRKSTYSVNTSTSSSSSTSAAAGAVPPSAQLQSRQALPPVLNHQQQQDTAKGYLDHFCPPAAVYLYATSSVLQMPYGNLGTLVRVLRLFASKKGYFSPAEHEYLVALIVFQVRYFRTRGLVASFFTICWFIFVLVLYANVNTDDRGSACTAFSRHPPLRHKDRLVLY
jgi:hypothetical protein